MDSHAMIRGRSRMKKCGFTRPHVRSVLKKKPDGDPSSTKEKREASASISRLVCLPSGDDGVQCRTILQKSSLCVDECMNGGQEIRVCTHSGGKEIRDMKAET